jgi:hypothetical protein
MAFDSQKYAQAQTNMIEPRLAATHLSAFDQTKLLDFAMILLDLPRARSILDALQFAHFDFTARPLSRCAVRGCNAKHFHESEILEPCEAPHFRIKAALG